MKKLKDIEEQVIKEYESEIFDIYNLELYSADDIRKSNVFDSGIEDKISKVAFDKNYEITIQEFNKIKDNIYKEYDRRRKGN